MKKRWLGISIIIFFAGAIWLLPGCSSREPAEEPASPQDEKAVRDAGPAVKKEPVIVKSIGFEEGADLWTPVDETVTIDFSVQTQHSGQRSLNIVGKSPKDLWDYAWGNGVALEPARKYRFATWMLVDFVDNEDYPPYMKCMIKLKGRWLANAETNRYDLSKTGQWQELSVAFGTPDRQGLLSIFSVEKGAPGTSVRVVMFIDDVTLSEVY